ncbi:MAG TPA: 50S ribosomal protein L10 [Thermoplasmata archaeon]|jgi:large subunit ribosomal protein L10|nr:MAG TPA: 50S ribosomal protein L10 [Thermoplasmata archaeon]
MAHVAEWKHGEVTEIASLMTHHKIIGIIDVGGIPAPQLQQMRGGIRAKAQIRSAKNTLILRALDEAEKQVKGISELKNEVHGQAAVIATDVNPFALFREIKAMRKNAPAKGGETAAHDIEVIAGDTPFKPGPIVGELQKVGIPAAISEGKVIIKSDKVLVEAGQKISRELAQMLSRIEIYPIELGLNLHAVFENGSIYRPDVLDIDMDRFMGQLRTASLTALTLSMEAGWANPQTIKPLLARAYRCAYTLAMDRNIYTKATTESLLAKAHASMLSVSSQVKPVSKEGENTPTK